MTLTEMEPGAATARLEPMLPADLPTRSRLVAEACEARGDRVWWNVNAGNEPSIRIARRIGFTRERRYELVALHAPLRSARRRA